VRKLVLVVLFQPIGIGKPFTDLGDPVPDGELGFSEFKIHSMVL
jgi:hypothetical protein